MWWSLHMCIPRISPCIPPPAYTTYTSTSIYHVYFHVYLHLHIPRTPPSCIYPIAVSRSVEMECSFEYEALETDIGTSAMVNAAAAAPAFSRSTFVSDHADDTALRRHVLLRTVRQSNASKRTFVSKVFSPVCTSVAAAERSAVCIPQSTHLRYTHVYMRIPLENSTENERSQADQNWIHPIVERLLITTPLDPRVWYRPGIIAK